MQQFPDVFVAPGVVITGDVVLSPGVNLWFGTVIRGDLARITLGPGVNIQDGCILHTDRDVPQDIEEGVVAGHGAILHGSRIGRDTLIGMGAVLLSGTEIGEGCVIGAGTVVVEGRHIPPRSLVMGTPGKVIRPTTPAEIERTRGICTRYQALARRYAQGDFPSWGSHGPASPSP
jgi:carbonic anhydrase/acetyltransferase-like protein (isoleucine patch superfamily)